MSEVAPPRKWDHEEGLRLFAEGWSIPRIAAYVGVSGASVRRVVDPVYRASGLDATRRSQKGAARCAGCGTPIWKGRERCQVCAGLARATTVRPDALLCRHCDEWLPDAAFHRASANKARRGRCDVCTGCAAEVRGDHRARNRAAERATNRAWRKRRRAERAAVIEGVLERARASLA